MASYWNSPLFTASGGAYHCDINSHLSSSQPEEVHIAVTLTPHLSSSQPEEVRTAVTPAGQDTNTDGR